MNCNAAGDPEEDRAYSDDELVDPEAERPCSCEESERLKARVAELDAERGKLAEMCGNAMGRLTVAEARVRELEADRDHFKGIWQVECDRTARALQHQETAEAALRALRERLETLCKGSGIPGAEPGIVLTRQVLEILRG
ncbi:MAG TPA: hypothetical protein VIU86_20115 [Gaiellaceae bacterium]